VKEGLAAALGEIRQLGTRPARRGLQVTTPAQTSSREEVDDWLWRFRHQPSITSERITPALPNRLALPFAATELSARLLFGFVYVLGLLFEFTLVLGFVHVAIWGSRLVAVGVTSIILIGVGEIGFLGSDRRGSSFRSGPRKTAARPQPKALPARTLAWLNAARHFGSKAGGGAVR
jgi:hypothetical protein